MNKDEVPQDSSDTFAGQRKGVYALDDEGAYALVPSSGWDVEEAVLQQALGQLQAQEADALMRYQKGQASILEYLMYQNRMDESLLAQSTGIFKWRLRRHFKPSIFSKLNQRVLIRYAQVFDVSVAYLREGEQQF